MSSSARRLRQETLGERSARTLRSGTGTRTPVSVWFDLPPLPPEVGSDTMPVRHRPDFKQALSTLRQLKPRGCSTTAKDGKAIPHLGGTGKNPGGILLMSITTKTYPALIDPGKPDRKVIGPLIRGMILRINVLQYSSKFGNSSLLSPTESVNTIPPKYRKNGFGNVYVKTMATVNEL